MEGSFLRFYVHEAHRHRGMLVWEWLLKHASEMEVRGGSAFAAVAGFGRHHILHEQTFFDLAGSVTVEVEFIVNDGEARRLLELVHNAKLRIFFAQIPTQFAIVNPDYEDVESLQAPLSSPPEH